MSYDQQYPHESELPAAGVQLNHTALYASDRHLSAEFLAAVLGLKVGAPFGPFLPVDLGNGVTLDYYEKRDEPIQSQHYAFLVPNEQFDVVITRLEVVGVTYYADPSHTEPGQIDRLFGAAGPDTRCLAYYNPLTLGAERLRDRSTPTAHDERHRDLSHDP